METISRFGRFSADGQRFDLTAEPPRRWRNAHYNGIGQGIEFMSEVSNLGDGPIHFRCDDGTTVQLVGYECKYVYIRDEDTGVVFCPGGAPVATPVTERVCRYSAATTELSATCGGLTATQRVFVPRAHPLEISTVTVANREPRPRRISVFVYARFDLPSPVAEVQPELGGVFVQRFSTEEVDERRRGFLCLTGPIHAATAHRDDFLRQEYCASTPRICWGHDLGGRGGFMHNAMAAVQTKLEIPAGGSVRVDALIGHAPTLAQACTLRAEMTPARIDALCAEQVAIEAERAAAFRVELGNPNLDGVVNGFLKKQLYAYLVDKTGFRDNLQVTMALAMADAPTCATVLLRALASQRAEGWPPEAYRPLRDNRRSDKPTWILMAVPALVKETGDTGFLQQIVPYLGGTESGTVWDHCLRAMRLLARDTRGHGLNDLHDGDWNDGLSPIGEAGGRESVMVSEQFCYGLLEMAALADHIGDAAVAKEARDLHAEFARRINAVAWDGDWYQRVLCDDGFVIGSARSTEGRIFMNSQSWAVIGRIAPPERAARCMDAVEEHLRLDIGYRITYPPFVTYDPRVGHSSTVMAGVIENGGCYNHAAGFKGVADCILGRPEHAWDTFRKVAPDNPDNPVAKSRMEPFAFVNMFFADKYTYGEAFYPWRTGTAAWMTMLLIEWILGARRAHAGLMIDPCLTKRVPRARVTRRFRGATFDIRLDNTAGRCRGVRSLTIDGTPVAGNILPDLRSGTHIVEAVI